MFFELSLSGIKDSILNITQKYQPKQIYKITI